MSISVTFHGSELVFACGAIEANVKRLRDFCRETDHKFGSMNDVVRGNIRECRSAHETMIEALRANGYPMSSRDILDDPIDERKSDV